IMLQDPVPTTGVFAASVVVVLHSTWSGPATAAVGAASTVMVTSSLLPGQSPPASEMVQRNVLDAPGVRSLTVVLGALGFAMVPVPLTKVQVPISPAPAEFACNEVDVTLHNNWSSP